MHVCMYEYSLGRPAYDLTIQPLDKAKPIKTNYVRLVICAWMCVCVSITVAVSVSVCMFMFACKQ